MFDTTSRYAKLAIKTLTVTGPDGLARNIQYVERRFPPQSDAGATIVEHTVTQGERLDNITAKYLGDPTQFWRVCDANEALNPKELTDEVGQRIRIAIPGM
jgi:hypothetical protein